MENTQVKFGVTEEKSQTQEMRLQNNPQQPVQLKPQVTKRIPDLVELQRKLMRQNHAS